MADDWSIEGDLDRFWNDLVAGTLPAGSGGLDPADAEAIRRFMDDAAAPQPRSSRDRVAARIDAEIGRLDHRGRANGRVHAADAWVAGDAATPAPERLPWSADPGSGGGGFVTRLALCAVAALVVGLVALGPWAGWRTGPDRRTAIPAAVAPPTAAALPGVAARDLVEFRIPAGRVPAGRSGAALYHLTLPAGAGTAAPQESGVHLRFVFSGVLSVQVDGPAQLLRAGGAWTPLPAGVAATLGEGDAVVSFGRADVSFANPETAPAEVLWFGLRTDDGATEYAALPDWIVNDAARAGRDHIPGGADLVLPGAPAVLRLARAVLEPGALVPAPPVDRLRLAVAVPDNGRGTPVPPDIAVPPNGRVRNAGATAVVVYAVTLEVPGAAGTPLAAGPEAPLGPSG